MCMDERNMELLENPFLVIDLRAPSYKIFSLLIKTVIALSLYLILVGLISLYVFTTPQAQKTNNITLPPN